MLARMHEKRLLGYRAIGYEVGLGVIETERNSWAEKALSVPSGRLAHLTHGSLNVSSLSSSFTGFVSVTSTIPVISVSLNAEAYPSFSLMPPGDLPASTTIF